MISVSVTVAASLIGHLQVGGEVMFIWMGSLYDAEAANLSLLPNKTVGIDSDGVFERMSRPGLEILLKLTVRCVHLSCCVVR